MDEGIGETPSNLFKDVKERAKTLFPGLAYRVRRTVPGRRSTARSFDPEGVGPAEKEPDSQIRALPGTSEGSLSL